MTQTIPPPNLPVRLKLYAIILSAQTAIAAHSVVLDV
jgi:hypothetical protein